MENRPGDILYCDSRKEVIDKANPVLDENVLKIMYEFIHDRHEVHKNKDVLKLPKPWTKNEIFQRVKFTNVFRQLDRESRNAIDNICSNHDYSLMDRCFNTILMRLWNKYESFLKATGDGKLIKFPMSDFDYQRICTNIETENMKGKYAWFSAAYNTSSVRNLGLKNGESRGFMTPVWFAKNYLTVDFWKELSFTKTPRELVDVIGKIPYIGGLFLTYQFFVDFTYNDDFWFSENEFVVSGLGCSRGIEHLFLDSDGMTPEECIFWLRDNQESMFGMFGYEPDKLFDDLPKCDRRLNVMSLENCFCELSKYIKCKAAIADGRKPRAKCNYDGIGRTTNLVT